MYVCMYVADPGRNREVVVEISQIADFSTTVGPRLFGACFVCAHIEIADQSIFTDRFFKLFYYA